MTRNVGESMDADAVQKQFEAPDWERLADMTNAEVGTRLVTLLQHYERNYPSGNVDRLVSIGVTTMNAGHEDVDIVVLGWLLERPSAPRFDLVATLLHGLWLRGEHRKPVSAGAIDALLRARQGLALDEQAEYDYALALTKVMTSSAPATITHRIAAELEAMLNREFDEPVFDEMLKPMIRRALAM